MDITYDILLEYGNITSFDMVSFFQNSLDFIGGDYQSIVAYYSGESKTITSNPFNNFSQLKLQRNAAFENFNSNRSKLTNLKWFLLLEKMEEIDDRLNTLDNINKWSRSSITKVGYDPSFQFGYTSKQNQSLENISQTVLGSSQSEDDWLNIALDNRLTEEDYSPAGGTFMNLKLNRANGFNYKINSVVDVIQGKSIYGKDLDNNFGFDTDLEDLRVLSYDDTILQAAYNLIKLRKNDVSSARSLGLQSSIVVGTNRGLLNFPVIIRQVTTTFAADDSLKDFSVNKIGLDQDNTTIEWSVKSRLGEVIANETTSV